MIYLPEDYLNENYSYFYNGDYYIIHTNNNCTDDLCDCYNIYQDNNYLVSSSYQCISPSDEYIIAFNRFTDDFYYRNDLANILISFAIIVCFGFGIPIYLLKQFKRSV